MCQTKIKKRSIQRRGGTIGPKKKKVDDNNNSTTHKKVVDVNMVDDAAEKNTMFNILSCPDCYASGSLMFK